MNIIFYINQVDNTAVEETSSCRVSSHPRKQHGSSSNAREKTYQTPVRREGGSPAKCAKGQGFPFSCASQALWGWRRYGDGGVLGVLVCFDSVWFLLHGVGDGTVPFITINAKMSGGRGERMAIHCITYLVTLK